MPSERNGKSRRRVLQLTGTALTGLIGATGAASARPGRGRGGDRGGGRRGPPDWARVQNGRFEMVMTKSEWQAAPGPSEIEGIPDEAQKTDYEVMQWAVERTNDALESGDAELHRRGERVDIEWDHDGGRGHWGDAR